MRYLAIDLGDKRTGLAAGDDCTKFVSPAGVIEIPRDSQEAKLIDAIVAAAREHGAEVFILGLPLNMDGSEGLRVKMVRAFGERLGAASGMPVEYHDERLTSFAADQAMARSGRTHQQKKRLRDQLAAAMILRGYLNSKNDASM